MIDYSRRRFNAMNHAEQRDYIARLESRTHYYINGVQVPKLVFDLVT